MRSQHQLQFFRPMSPAELLFAANGDYGFTDHLQT